eukprot:1157645-Pelagomonas_calceolata.AAC.2
MQGTRGSNTARTISKRLAPFVRGVKICSTEKQRWRANKAHYLSKGNTCCALQLVPLSVGETVPFNGA